MKLFFCLSLFPLALYLAGIGWINVRRRPAMLSAWRDVNLLGLALSGLAIVGPLELFLPETAAFRFGPWVWGLMVALYFLLVSLCSMMMRPRLVIYNLTGDELRPVLADAARQLDPQARWSGDSLALPKLGIRLFIESAPALRNVQLISVGRDQDDSGWRRLEKELRTRLRATDTERNPRGFQMLTMAVFLLGLVIFLLASDYNEIHVSLSELLRL